MCLLVVDDSRAVRAVRKQVPHPLGYEATEAAEGSEEPERPKKTCRPRFALVDWNMPEMNGWASSGLCRPTGADATRRSWWPPRKRKRSRPFGLSRLAPMDLWWR